MRVPGAKIELQVRADGLVWITIDRQSKHNALSLSVLDALAATVQNASRDANTRCIVLRGAGDQYFAAGGDLVELAAVRSDAEIDTMSLRAAGALDAIRNCPVPTVAYLNGDALGGGAELCVACDMRLLAPHARIGFIQARMGITSAWGGGPDLMALVGPARAMQMMARCTMIEAAQAVSWGLADAEVRDGPDGADMTAFLQPLLDRSTHVLRGVKAQAIAWRRGGTLSERRDVERTQLRTTWASAEHWAAVDRFLAKDK